MQADSVTHASTLPKIDEYFSSGANKADVSSRKKKRSTVISKKSSLPMIHFPKRGLRSLAMGRFRKDRVSELLREVIADVVRRRIKDPRVEGVTITEVRMSNDLKSAMVFFCSLTDGKAELHKQGLEAAAGFIRREIRNEADLKYAPSLTFEYDTSFDNFDRINKILKTIQPEEPHDDQ
jgi:ribosome-binding factor A